MPQDLPAGLREPEATTQPPTSQDTFARGGFNIKSNRKAGPWLSGSRAILREAIQGCRRIIRRARTDRAAGLATTFVVPPLIRCATRYVEKPTRRMGEYPGSTPTGTRTPVPWLRTKYPRPLDDGGMLTNGIISSWESQSSLCQSPDNITASGLVGTSHSTVICQACRFVTPSLKNSRQPGDSTRVLSELV